VSTPLRFSPLAEIDQLADALGDPTRRAILAHVSASREQLTASDVSQSFGIHRTVARAHLERLVDTGLLSSHARHRPEGGRPPKVYERSESCVSVQLPPRQYELLAELLLETLDRFGEAAEVLVQQVGYDFGLSLAGANGGSGVLSRLEPLTRAGADFDAQAEGDRVEIQLRNCVFHELAQKRPALVCSLDQAVVRGILSTGEDTYVLEEVVRQSVGGGCRLVYRAPASIDPHGL
jgi:predicted ArsR family transcriptional regulator